MFWNDPEGIELRMGRKVMHLDVFDVGSGLDFRNGVHPAHKFEQMRIIRDSLVARLEVNDVHGIESHQSLVQSEVDPGQILPRQKWNALGLVLSQMLFELVEGGKDIFVCRTVGLLGRGKSTSVNPIVDIRVNVFVEGIQLLGFVALGKERSFRMLGQFVKCAVEKFENLDAFVAHYRLFFLVPQHRCRIFSGRVVGQFVQVADGFATIHRVGNTGIVALVASVSESIGNRIITGGSEKPSAVLVLGVVGPRSSPGGMDDRMANSVIEAFVSHRREGSCGPWTRQRNIKVVSVRLGFEAPALFYDIALKSGGGALESSVLVGFFERCSCLVGHGVEKTTSLCFVMESRVDWWLGLSESLLLLLLQILWDVTISFSNGLVMF